MDGIQFITNEKGQKEPRESLESVKKLLTKQGKLA